MPKLQVTTASTTRAHRTGDVVHELAAFNIGWHEQPKRRIYSFIAPRGLLTKPGMANHAGSHAEHYAGFPQLVTMRPVFIARLESGNLAVPAVIVVEGAAQDGRANH